MILLSLYSEYMYSENTFYYSLGTAIRFSDVSFDIIQNDGSSMFLDPDEYIRVL